MANLDRGMLLALLIVLLLLGSVFSLRFLDGPVFFVHGGPLKAGERVEYADVDWDSLDKMRAFEVELVGKGRSLLLWFSVTDGRPYISCGLRCEDRGLKRWPHSLDEDPRVVVRIAGTRIDARAERVAYDSPEFLAARAERRAKFSGGDVRSEAEHVMHDAIIDLGSQDTKSQGEDAESGRLYRIVPR